MSTPTTASLIAQLDTLIVRGCKALRPVKALPALCVYGMQKSGGADSFTVLFTARCAYVAHETLGTFRVSFRS
jgi:hypothetical protein